MAAAVVGLGLAACENEEYAALTQLREELKASNDTVFAFSMRNHYALWIHTDEPRSGWEGPNDGTYSLYYRDLQTGKTERLFTTLKDTLRLMPGERGHRVAPGFDLRFSPDSSALILSDDTYVTAYFVCLYPLTGDRKTLYFLTHDRYATEERENVYRGEKYIPFQQFEWFEGLLDDGTERLPWYPSGGTRYLYYNTRGEVIDSSSTISTSCREKGSIDRHQRQTITLTEAEFNEPRRWVRRLLLTQAYTVEELYAMAHNEARFNRTFKDEEGDRITKFFSLRVHSLEETEVGGETYYIVKGDGFSITSTDEAFADLNYPCSIIMRSTVSTMAELEERLSNPLTLYMLSVFSAVDGGQTVGLMAHLEGDFVFADASLIIH